MSHFSRTYELISLKLFEILNANLELCFQSWNFRKSKTRSKKFSTTIDTIEINIIDNKESEHFEDNKTGKCIYLKINTKLNLKRRFKNF